MARVKIVSFKDFAKQAGNIANNKVRRLDLLSNRKDLRIRACASKKGSWPLSVQTEGHFFLVLQGKITFQVAPIRRGKPALDKVEKHVLGVGDAIVIPANMAHGGSVRGLALAAEVVMPVF